MKITLTFILPDEQEEHKHAFYGNEYHSMLLDLVNQFRGWDKIDREPTYEEIKEYFFDLLQKTHFW